MTALARAAVLAALFALLFPVPDASAGGVNCPQWLGGRAVVAASAAIAPVVECWAPRVTYHENIALLHDDPPVYLTKIETLMESAHTFDTQAELEAYIQQVLVVRGFWFEHPLRGRILVPPSAFDEVAPVQILHHSQER